MWLEKDAARFRLAVQNMTAPSDVARLVFVQNLKDIVACHMPVLLLETEIAYSHGCQEESLSRKPFFKS